MGRALLAYGRKLEADGAAQTGSSFTGDECADTLLYDEPNALLLGILFTQGIPAERAWAGPWELRRRLGTLDLDVLAGDPDAVREAIQAPPMLHRFKNTMPRWISAAASRLLSEYGGDASNVWSPGSHVIEVTERLTSFDGIGRKKSVMAVQILHRHFGIPFQGMECGQVAFDVQVRRVFLRTGLADADTPQAIEAAAQRVCPTAPGTLDLAAWLVGRETCRPKAPLCEECRLGHVCARRVWLTPRGVGGAARDRG